MTALPEDRIERMLEASRPGAEPTGADTSSDETTGEPAEEVTPSDVVVQPPAEGGEPQRQLVPPMPVPEAWFVDPYVYPDGQPGVQITVSGPTGITVHFMPRQYALNHAAELKKTALRGPSIMAVSEANARASGLVLP